MSNFLFPIETTARELDHKILMAVRTAKPDRSVIVGDQQYIRNLSYLVRTGVFYGKHLFGKPKFSDTAYYQRLKSRGFKVLHLNEEGAVWPGREKIWTELLLQAERPSVLGDDDALATWGEWQRKFDLSYEEVSARVVATGHPKFDLCREQYFDYFKPQIEKIGNEYGRYVLINTAFSYANNGEGGLDFIFKPTMSYDPKSPENRKYRFSRWARQSRSIADIVELVNILALKYPDLTFVIRPHPSEATETYQSIFAGVANVKVVYEGSVTPWILGSDVLIHNGCTTAIEASLAGKPVLNFSSQQDEATDVFLANICGKTIVNVEQGEEVFAKMIAQLEPAELPSNELANDLFMNFSKANTADSVIELLESLDEKNGSGKDVGVGTLFFSMVMHFLYLKVKNTVLMFMGKKKKVLDHRKRFGSFDKQEIQGCVERMAAIENVNVKITFCSKYFFVVKSAD